MNILTLWPIARWILQALGLMGPEDREKEKEYRLKLLEAAERKDAALIKAFADFQGLWRPSADRVYVFANTAIALFQPTILALIYYDVIWGQRRSIQAAQDLEKAGIPGLLIMAIMLFPFYGPALVSAVGDAFRSAVDLASKRVGSRPVVRAEAGSSNRNAEELPGETELERLGRLNRERNTEIIEETRDREERRRPDDPDAQPSGLDR